MEDRFGFNFAGKNNESVLVRTAIIHQSLALDDMLSTVKTYARRLSWPPAFATLKRLIFFDGESEPKRNAPSTGGRSQLQAYIFIKHGQKVENVNGITSVDGKALDLDFSMYEVHIIEL